MTYRCLICGHERTGPKKTACPKCGNEMLSLPFNRREELEKRAYAPLDSFLNLVPGFQNAEFPDYEKECASFPDADKILHYILVPRKLEDVFARMEETIKRLKEYAMTTLDKEYEGSFDTYRHHLLDEEAKLRNFLKTFSVDAVFQPLELPKAYAHIRRVPDESLMPLVEETVEGLERLEKKLRRYLSQNNLSLPRKTTFDPKRELDREKNIEGWEESRSHLKEILDKTFLPDLLEVEDPNIPLMLNAFLENVAALRNAPLFLESRSYHCQGEEENVFPSKPQETIRMIGEELREKLKASLTSLSDEDLARKISSICEKKEENTKGQTEGERKLSSLVGLSSIKKTLTKIKAYLLSHKEDKTINLHMAFLGNPGTGKTEVARLVAEILYENHILPKNKIVETDRSGLVGEYVGETPIKTKKKIEEAMGGVLFIDEAYSLLPSGKGFDYGQECLSTLLKAMEDERGQFCVIFAGYKDEMERMMNSNPGLKSRIPFQLVFPDYTREDLSLILEKMLNDKEYTMDEEGKNAVMDIVERKRIEPNFANAREVRNILDATLLNQSLRVQDSENRDIGYVDVLTYAKENNVPIKKPKEGESSTILTAQEELDSLVGLTDIKRTIRKIRAYAKKNKEDARLSLHMAFLGNPGTGKTEVARILSRILYEGGALPSATFVEVGAEGLLGEYVGETAQKTKRIVEQAMGGILFVDEAYALMGEKKTSYGPEAIAVLLKAMEDHQGEFSVIFAGYPEPMQRMFSYNPGLLSRIAFQLHFPDYVKEELREIGRRMLQKKNYSIKGDALEEILLAVERRRNKRDFANARTLRNIVEQVLLEQNVRTEATMDDKTILIEDVRAWEAENQEEGISLAPIPMTVFLDDQRKDGVLLDDKAIESAVLSLSSADGGQGTGFFISSDGLLLTCAHVVGIQSAIKARVAFFLHDGQKVFSYYDAALLRKDEENDLALLRIKAEGFRFPYFHLEGRDYPMRPRTRFLTAGYPFGGEMYPNISLTEGQIASVNKIGARKNVFADMFGKPGNSGSPVMDGTTRKVIGLFWGGIGDAEGETIKCFTPVDVLWDFLEETLKGE